MPPSCASIPAVSEPQRDRSTCTLHAAADVFEVTAATELRQRWRAQACSSVRSEKRRSSVRRPQILTGTDGDDTVRIDMRMASKVVLLDVIYVDCRRDVTVLVHVEGVCVEGWVLADGPLVAFEVDDIDLVEAYQRNEKAHVRLSELRVAAQVSLFREQCLVLVQARKQGCHGL